MNKDIKQVIEKFVNQVVENHSDIIIEMILFGSVAKGISGPDSDCDILIVMKEKDRSVKSQIYSIVVDFWLKYKIDISLKFRTEKQYEYGMSLQTPFMKELKETGQVLWNKTQLNK